MIKKLNKILQKKGAEALLPQNLPDDLANSLADECMYMIEIFSGNPYGVVEADNRRTKKGREIIIFLVLAFDPEDKIVGDERLAAIRSLTYYYAIEKSRRVDKKAKYRLPTVDTILKRTT